MTIQYAGTSIDVGAIPSNTLKMEALGLAKMNKGILAAILSVELLIFFNMDMFLSGFPIYVTNMGIREDRMGILFGVFMLSGMLFRPLLAKIGQRYGQKLILAIGTVVAFSAPWLYLLVDSFGGIIAIRMFHGLVPASFITATQLLLIREAGEDHKAVGLGLFGLMGGLSMMIIPYFGVHVLATYGRVIWLGGASFFGALSMLIFWLRVGPNAKDVEVATEPPAPLNLRLIGAPLVSNVLLALGFGSVITYVTTYGLSVGYTNPGQFFTVLAFTNILIKILFSIFGDRLPQRIIMIPGTAVFAGGLLLLAVPPSPAWVVWSAIPIGVGFFATVGMMMLNVTNAVPGVQRSMAAALMANSIDLGLATASIFLGVLVTAGSYSVLYTFACGCALLAMVIMIVKLRERAAPKAATADAA